MMTVQIPYIQSELMLTKTIYFRKTPQASIMCYVVRACTSSQRRAEVPSDGFYSQNANYCSQQRVHDITERITLYYIFVHMGFVGPLAILYYRGLLHHATGTCWRRQCYRAFGRYFGRSLLFCLSLIATNTLRRLVEQW